MLKDKVVVITGAGGGIGRDFALAMSAKGAKIVVNDVGASVSGEGKNAGPAQKVVDEIKAKGGQAVANTYSVAEWEAANRFIKTAIDKVSKAGGKVLGEPMEIPGVGQYVSFFDTEGNRVSMLQPLPRMTTRPKSR